MRANIERAAFIDLVVTEISAAWPEPKPIIVELLPVAPFDADKLLPGPLRAWIMDEAERMPCPPDFIAVAAAAGVVPSLAHVAPSNRRLGDRG